MACNGISRMSICGLSEMIRALLNTEGIRSLIGTSHNTGISTLTVGMSENDRSHVIKVGDSIPFITWHSDGMLEMLNTADVCVNPDVANEINDKSTMNKIMEYMALGKPVVQFDLTEGHFSAQEASLYAEKNSELDLAKKIVELLDDPEAREKMGRFGRNRVENELEWKYEAPRLLHAYDVAFERR